MSTTAQRHRKQICSVELLEHYVGGDHKVDRESGIISDVKVLGAISRNGKAYSPAAQRDLCRLLEGITVNIDHDRSPTGSERSFLSSVGVLRGLEMRGDGVYAKQLCIKKSHPNANLIFESAENFPNNFGLSINAHGMFNDRTKMVQSIVKAHSVDIVQKPATTQGLFESEEPPQKARKMITTSIRKIVESIGAGAKNAAAIKARGAKLIESTGGDSAIMGAPVQMEDPAVSDDGDATDPDPMEQLDDAFAALVISVISNDGLTLEEKISQITTILTTQDTLVNGGSNGAPAKKPAPVKEDEEEDDMTESLKESFQKLTESVNSSIDIGNRNAMSIRLMGAKIEVSHEKIDALMAAKDEPSRVALIESWPAKQPAVTREKPKMKVLVESEEVSEFPSDFKSFMSAVKG